VKSPATSAVELMATTPALAKLIPIDHAEGTLFTVSPPAMSCKPRSSESRVAGMRHFGGAS
jgi:hypothetical protein